ncbi:diaminopimelate decarboxylase [Neoroseomonas oryzicola]|uniref:Diaminopimelate decarboxylase n=1 Tax=Neoroseomonas oryzicola TaxID=535904 RepID=A0A9X9WDP5_9PROT|nr:diaminopimelate decarboxylase [Neoroseomonas oryzicola]MBR0658455.1 diaminopimelate decarboxylase [Neoroseomonas oryzicola]NKE17644.1 diaminopimelate decarboxylase [Neoroseomonas oryzicola]
MAAPLALTDAADPSFAELLALRPHLSLHAMDGLVMEEVPLARIAKEVGTPAWVYSAGALRRRARSLKSALTNAGLTATVHFAMKCNDNLAVLKVLAAEGLGADVVSEGELRIARAAGIPASAIVFSGVGKTASEIRHAIEQDIFQINAESAEEIAMISAIADGLGKTARVALRVNPDVDAKTHAKITTGKSENKFGVAFEDAPAIYAHMAALPGIAPMGIATHIGSQITAGMAAYRAAYARLAEMVKALRAQGLPVERVDCGGGLGIPYRDEPAPSPEALAGAIRATLGELGLPVMLEPGRWIAGPAGVLLASVVLQKQGAAHRFVVVDAAMNDLVRPAMYEAWHGIVPVSGARAASPLSAAEVVGPVCETGDTFARGRLLPHLATGDAVAFLDAGAYGAVMSSTYNARPLAPEVLVDGTRYAVVRERQTYEELLHGQRVPGWLAT